MTDLGHPLAQLPKQSLTTGFKAGAFTYSDWLKFCYCTCLEMLPLCLSQGLGAYLMLQAVWIKPKTVPNSHKKYLWEGKVEGGERKRWHLKHSHRPSTTQPCSCLRDCHFRKLVERSCRFVLAYWCLSLLPKRVSVCKAESAVGRFLH